MFPKTWIRIQIGDDYFTDYKILWGWETASLQIHVPFKNPYGSKRHTVIFFETGLRKTVTDWDRAPIEIEPSNPAAGISQATFAEPRIRHAFIKVKLSL